MLRVLLILLLLRQQKLEKNLLGGIFLVIFIDDSIRSFTIVILLSIYLYFNKYIGIYVMHFSICLNFQDT